MVYIPVLQTAKEKIPLCLVGMGQGYEIFYKEFQKVIATHCNFQTYTWCASLIAMLAIM